MSQCPERTVDTPPVSRETLHRGQRALPDERSRRPHSGCPAPDVSRETSRTVAASRESRWPAGTAQAYVPPSRGPDSPLRGADSRERPSPDGSSRPPATGRPRRQPGAPRPRRRPPTFKNLTAHSAVTAGGPNDREVTRSARLSRSSRRASSSARPISTLPPEGASGQSRTSRRKAVRRSMESMRIPRADHRASRTRPGSPPPLPRSTKTRGESGRSLSQQRAKPSAWVIWGPIGPGPKKPRALDSSRARVNQSFVTATLCRSHHHESARLLAF